MPVTLGKTHGQRSNSPVTVDYAVTSLTGDTATAGSDYTAATGTLTFAPGQSVKNIPVAITNDTTTEAAEHFHVVLSNPTGGELADPTGLITIGANDQTTVPAPAISVGPDQLVGEGDGYVDLPVTLVSTLHQHRHRRLHHRRRLRRRVQQRRLHRHHRHPGLRPRPNTQNRPHRTHRRHRRREP